MPALRVSRVVLAALACALVAAAPAAADGNGPFVELATPFGAYYHDDLVNRIAVLEFRQRVSDERMTA